VWDYSPARFGQSGLGLHNQSSLQPAGPAFFWNNFKPWALNKCVPLYRGRRMKVFGHFGAFGKRILRIIFWLAGRWEKKWDSA
jgi:hypothetical protein